MPDEPNDSSERPRAGHFAVGGELARGGMGNILEATDQTLGRTVAMKCILLERDAHPHARQRFIREATILARLEHPNIIPIHELGKDDHGRLFYVMKKVDGRTLQSVIDGLGARDPQTLADFPLDRLLTAFVKVCDALAFAHSRGVIHRDLKPENVMIGAFGEVLVMDWGLAKSTRTEDHDTLADPDLVESAEDGGRQVMDDFLGDLSEKLEEDSEADEFGVADDDQLLTMDGVVIGSPRFMPPEQAEGRIQEIDERSDIFSLGAILYSILTLQAPAGGSSVEEVLEKVKSGNIIPPTDYRSSGTRADSGNHANSRPAVMPQTAAPPHCPGGKVPAALSAVAMRALAFRPVERYQQVPELSADIEAYRGGFATSVENVGLLGQLWLLGKRHQGVSLMCLGALLMATGFMIKVFASERRAVANANAANTQRGLADIARTAAEQEKDNANLERERALRALGEAKLALAEAAYVNNDVTAMVRELQDYPQSMRATNSTWQYLWNQRSASLGDLPYAIPSRVGSACFTPGKPGMLAVERPGAVAYVDLIDGSEKQTIVTGVTNACLAFSGDGRILAASSSGSKYVTLFDATTGRRRELIRIPSGAAKVMLNHDGQVVGVSLIGGAGVNADRLVFYETGGGTKIREFEVNGPHVAAFHPDGEIIAAGAQGGFLTLFRRGEDRLIIEERKRIGSVEFSPDGTRLAVTTWDGYLRLHDSVTGHQINSTKVFQTGYSRSVWASNEHLITHAPGEGGWLTQVWAADGLVTVKTFFGALIAEPTYWIYDRQTGYLVLPGGPARIARIPIGLEYRVLPVENGGTSLTGLVDLSVSLPADHLALASGRPLMTLHDFSAEPRRLEFDSILRGAIATVHHGRGLIAQAGRYPADPAPLRVFQLRQGIPEHLFDAPIPAGVVNLSFNLAGDRLLVLYRDGKSMEVFSSQDGASLRHLASPQQRHLVHAEFVGTNGHIVVAMKPKTTPDGVDETRVMVLDGSNGQPLAEVIVEQRVTSMAVSPDAEEVALGISDGTVRFYRADGLEFLKELRVHDDAVTVLAWHPANHRIATASLDLSVKVWDCDTGRRLHRFIGLTSAPNDLAFSPSGELLAVIDKGETVRVWRLTDGNSRPAMPPIH